MQEVSILSLLSQQQEKNRKAYDSLFSSLNLSRMKRYDNLPSITESSYKVLHAAGFIPETIVDKLTQTSLLLLIHLAKQDISRIYLKEDIGRIAQEYGLKFLETRYYQGKKKEVFVDDLNAFQQQVVTIIENTFWTDNIFSFQYYALGSSRTFDGMDTSAFKAPLLFYHLGEGIYYLISSYDSWIKKVRRVVYWPIASRIRMIATWAFLFFVYVTTLVLSDNPVIFVSAMLLFIFTLHFSLVKSDWNMPDYLPLRFKRKMYRLIPYEN